MRRLLLTLVLLALAAPVALGAGDLSGDDRSAERLCAGGDRDQGTHRLCRLRRQWRNLGRRPSHRPGDVIVPGAPGTRSATGIEYDHGLLWVSGARFGNALVYDAKTGVLLQELQLATGTAPTFINDAVATQRGVYFTDSQRPVLYKVERTGHHVGQVTTIPLGGDYHHVAGRST